MSDTAWRGVGQSGEAGVARWRRGGRGERCGCRGRVLSVFAPGRGQDGTQVSSRATCAPALDSCLQLVIIHGITLRPERALECDGHNERCPACPVQQPPVLPKAREQLILYGEQAEAEEEDENVDQPRARKRRGQPRGRPANVEVTVIFDLRLLLRRAVQPTARESVGSSGGRGPSSREG